MFHFPLSPTSRLRLLNEADAEPLFQVIDRDRAHLRQWLPWVDSSRGPDDIRAFIRTSRERFARNDAFDAAIEADGALVGAIGLHDLNRVDRRTKIGYWLAATAQGRGLMTAACRAVVNHVFVEMKLNRVEILCATGNTRSRRIPERLGFTQEGIARQAGFWYDHDVDLVVYAMLAEEWPRRAGSAPAEVS
jgi:ribosomal-protein-serine acetyltransferase